jgi:hypothetical protein
MTQQEVIGTVKQEPLSSSYNVAWLSKVNGDVYMCTRLNVADSFRAKQFNIQDSLI